jgi:preprotein translocase subunit SecF
MDLINEKALDAYIKNVTLKQLLIVPAILLLLSLTILAYNVITKQTPVELGMEFKGGTTISFDSDKTPDQLREEFKNYPLIQARAYDADQRKILQFSPMDESKLNAIIQKMNSEYRNVEISQMGEVVSKSLQGQALEAILFSFIGMAIVVFIIFRTFVPSIAVVISAFADIVFAMAMMNVFGIVLSFGTLAALLMLIGYSVDTDILLTTRLLKRKGELQDKLREAMKTGLTMTFTTLAALVALFFVSSGSSLISSFTRIDIIRDISVVLIFGLIGDIINTWMTNVGILRWYMEKQKRPAAPIEKSKKKRQTA